MSFTLYRLAFTDPLTFLEQLGDPVTTQGGAPVPALRSALRHSVSTLGMPPSAGTAEDTVAARLKLRRQWRSLMNNTPMKLTGLYLGWDADPENNGWYVPDMGQLVDIEGAAGLATGVFKGEGFVWILAGRPRTHRRAVWIYLKDLRTGQWARDYRRLLYSEDFAGIPVLNLSYFPPETDDRVLTASGAAVSALTLPTGADGKGGLAIKLTDLARVSYEQPEASINTGQVIAYDRRGEQTGPAGGPGAAWEEIYGPDYQYSWVGPEASPIDTPVLDNGRCRVRYDATETPGWRVDVFTAPNWVEQCKITIVHKGPSITTPDVRTTSGVLAEYSETRAVVQAVMNTPSDSVSREEVIITLQRGWTGPRFEVYPAVNAAGEKINVLLQVDLATVDTDDSAVKIDAGSSGVIVATAKGTGHTGLWTLAGVGAAEFSGENEVIIGRWGASYGLALAVVQHSLVVEVGEGEAYGEPRNAVLISGTGAGQGYCSVQLGFSKQQAQQALEAESMTLGTGTTSTVDAAASGGKAATATRTTDANPHTTQATWPNNYRGTYRVYARVKTSLKTSKVKIYAKTSATTGATKESAVEAYGWVDLGDIVSNGTTLEIHAWLSAAGTISVDRIEAFLVEDRGVGGSYAGGRDLGQAILTDSRTIPTLVTRSV